MEYIISIMETYRLRHFKSVVDAGGITKASELIGISPGGLSKSIKALEVELGHKLFHQKGRGLELTDMGQSFYQKLPEVLAALESLISIDAIPTKETIRFVTFEVFSTYFLTNFLIDLNYEKNISVREAIPGEMEKLIAEGNADIGISYEPIPHRGVEFLKVSKIKMGIFIQKNSSLALKDLLELPFAVPLNPIAGTPSGVKGLDGWPEHLFHRKAVYKFDMMQTALLLASKGIAAAFLPQFIADLFNQTTISRHQLDEYRPGNKFKTVYRDIYIIIRKGHEEDAIIKKLAKSLRQL